ncbi:hypothetical protein NM208_g16886 [Fusarium decemcellulare]|uniref:Uncharacterized protein n=1 Tax=Fusarium decemcellulare TaxID=57161 RepID=A0ACC1RA52_9HYPO|nr:hypothetical protein NM208_g16886 [Fusarium decemcellulare]
MAIDEANNDPSLERVFGGTYSDKTGYFIQPTVYASKSLNHKLFEQELFGPVLAVHVYEDAEFDNLLTKIDEQGGGFALTGSIFAADRTIVQKAEDKLRYAAGNFYVNCKTTGAVIGQQSFGGSRSSGTNDKAGSPNLLMRFTSPRTLKEDYHISASFSNPVPVIVTGHGSPPPAAEVRFNHSTPTMVPIFPRLALAATAYANPPSLGLVCVCGVPIASHCSGCAQPSWRRRDYIRECMQHGSPEICILSHAILGGGAWGLSTALHLVDTGYTNITVFERDQRIPSQYSAAYDLNKIIRAEYEDPFYTSLTVDAMKAWKTPLFGPYYHQTGYINCTSGRAPEKSVVTLNKNLASVKAHPELKDGVQSLGSPDEFRKFAWQLTGPLQGFQGYFNKTAGYGHSGNTLKAVYNYCATKGVRFILGEQAGKVTSLTYDNSGRVTGLETANAELLSFPH